MVISLVTNDLQDFPVGNLLCSYLSTFNSKFVESLLLFSQLSSAVYMIGFETQFIMFELIYLFVFQYKLIACLRVSCISSHFAKFVYREVKIWHDMSSETSFIYSYFTCRIYCIIMQRMITLKNHVVNGNIYDKFVIVLIPIMHHFIYFYKLSKFLKQIDKLIIGSN